MKRLLTFLLILSIFTGCDDGDLTIENIDFENVNASMCENLVYKISGNEALIIEFPSAELAIVNDPTQVGLPRVFTINGSSTRVLYRSYNGDVSAASFCGNIPPPSPVVEEQWVATSGTIEVTTTAIKTPNDDFEGGELITGYRHSIILRNVEFEKPNGSQLYEEFVFGNYTTPMPPLTFAFTDPADRCDSGRLYNWISTEAMTIDNLDPALLVNEVTPLGQPRTALISATNNAVTYRRFNGGLSADYICSDPQPLTPEAIQTWTAADGVAGTSGIIEVITTTTSDGFLHEIHLRNVTLRSGNSEFILADDFLFGTIITSN